MAKKPTRKPIAHTVVPLKIKGVHGEYDAHLFFDPYKVLTRLIPKAAKSKFMRAKMLWGMVEVRLTERAR